jgi:hypothetical protein
VLGGEPPRELEELAHELRAGPARGLDPHVVRLVKRRHDVVPSIAFDLGALVAVAPPRQQPQVVVEQVQCDVVDAPPRARRRGGSIRVVEAAQQREKLGALFVQELEDLNRARGSQHAGMVVRAT